MRIGFSLSKVAIVCVFVGLSIFSSMPSIHGIVAGIALIESLVILDYEERLAK